MNDAAVVADVVAGQRAHAIPAATLPYSLLSYNISLNLSSIFNMLPASRFLTRWKLGNLGNLLDPPDLPTASLAGDWGAASDSTTFASVTTPISMPAAAPALELDQLSAFPGPWGFFTSWYMLGLLFMGVLLHRIQNLVIPSRLPPPSRRARHAYRFGPTFASPIQYGALWRRVHSAILPLDFSRTSTRLALHLPSMYLLCKMLLVWSILILQTSELFPVFSEEQKVAYFGTLGWLSSVGNWVAQKEMGTICWETFCAVCAGFLVEGFIKALDGIGGGFPIGNVNANTSPFNLVGYAFLLHVYSSPTAHSFKPSDESQSRPDKHVIITIAIPLLQLTILHILSVSKRLSTHRLFPTTLTSLLSLLHFHGTLFFHFFTKSTSDAKPSPTTTITPSHPYLKHSSLNYPLLNYIPNMFETVLIGLILLTISLNALVQLLVRGRVDRLLSGLGVGPGTSLQDDDEATPGFFESLPLEEDFGVLLLRVGVASLEATGLRGWGNEVAPVNLPLRARRHRDASAIDASDTQSMYGVVRMGRLGVGEVHHGSSSATQAYSTGVSRRRNRPTSSKKNNVRGYNNEVRTVDLGITDAGDIARSYRWKWMKEFWQLVVAFGGVLKGLVIFLIERAKGRAGMRDFAAAKPPAGTAAQDSSDSQQVDGDDEEKKIASLTRKKERETYQRFLRGEEISDDDIEDEEYKEGAEDSEEENLSEDGEELEEDREAEAIGLFKDLLRNAHGRAQSPSSPSGSSGGEMVLAHLAHGGLASGISSSPLTRRRWNALLNNNDQVPNRFRVSPSPGIGEYDDYDPWEINDASGAQIRRRTIFDEDGGQQQGMQSMCVICTVSARDIICWPCRCLAMCDNCREALASKSAPSKHRCPCCRQSVEGYSRIYIP